MRRQADFYATLDKVVAAVGGAMNRARVLISSRISEWPPESDRQVMLGRFGPASMRNRQAAKVSERPGISGLRVVAIDFRNPS